MVFGLSKKEKIVNLIIEIKKKITELDLGCTNFSGIEVEINKLFNPTPYNSKIDESKFQSIPSLRGTVDSIIKILSKTSDLFNAKVLSENGFLPHADDSLQRNSKKELITKAEFILNNLNTLASNIIVLKDKDSSIVTKKERFDNSIQQIESIKTYLNLLKKNLEGALNGENPLLCQIKIPKNTEAKSLKRQLIGAATAASIGLSALVGGTAVHNAANIERKVNKFDLRDYALSLLKIKGHTPNDTEIIFASSLNRNLNKLASYFALSPGEAKLIAKLSYGILVRESKSGESKRFYLKKIADKTLMDLGIDLGSILNLSRGPTQIKLSKNFNPEELNDLNLSSDTIYNTENAAIATFAILAKNFNLAKSKGFIGDKLIKITILSFNAGARIIEKAIPNTEVKYTTKTKSGVITSEGYIAAVLEAAENMEIA